MMASSNLLQQLRTLSAVDCDTLDVGTARDLGPFENCTSNQAIAFIELGVKNDGDSSSLKYGKLIEKAIATANWMFGKQSDATLEELAVELMMVQLSLEFAPVVKRHLLVQTNPKWSYSTQKTVKNAERIVTHLQHFIPEFDTSRICIKIPSTWEGIQACRELERKGIATLATTMFSMEQAVLAGAAGCTYIAPYVNELKVHFDDSYEDTDKAFAFCAEAQRYYQARGLKTQVMAASLTSIEEVMMLAGLSHITVMPGLLRELAGQDAKSWKGSELTGQSLRDLGSAPSITDAVADTIVGNEAAWRFAFTRSKEGRNEGKNIQAINIFSDFQDKLEKMVKEYRPGTRSS